MKAFLLNKATRPKRRIKTNKNQKTISGNTLRRRLTSNKIETFKQTIKDVIGKNFEITKRDINVTGNIKLKVDLDLLKTESQVELNSAPCIRKNTIIKWC